MAFLNEVIRYLSGSVQASVGTMRMHSMVIILISLVEVFLLTTPTSFSYSFLKMVSSGPGTSIINFSDRFTISDTTGSFSDKIKENVLSISDPSGQMIRAHHEREELRKRQNIGAYTIPYGQQSGLTRYAPMAKRPGTAITATVTAPQYPTSAYALATTFFAEATIKTTLSATATYSVSSVENTVRTVFHGPLFPSSRVAR